MSSARYEFHIDQVFVICNSAFVSFFLIDIRDGTKSDGMAVHAEKANVKCLKKLDFAHRIDIFPAYRSA
jgi:hypothetical protein